MIPIPKEKLQQRVDLLAKKLASPALLQDSRKLRQLSREHRRITELLRLVAEHERLISQREQAKVLLQDQEMKKLAQEELEQKTREIAQLEQQMEKVLLSEDELEKRNVFLEIRAGTGGEEAALFAADLLRMYQRFAEQKGFTFQVLNMSETELGGIKEVTAHVKGKNAFSTLKYESGAHRVQRVPRTESSGRIHTSAATVAVLPEAKEEDLEIKEKEIKMDLFRASGAGGQHVNKTSSAVRLTHLPTGIVVCCQDERSQYQNRMKAMQILRAHLLEKQEREKREKEAKERRLQIGSGDRSEKIRTYNFPQDRVTDHRLEGEKKNAVLSSVLEGNLHPLIASLKEKERKEKIERWLKELI